MATPNASYGDLLSTTLANHMPKLVDNIFTARPLFWFLKQAGQVRQVAGGAKIVLPVMYAGNATAVPYANVDTLSTSAAPGAIAADTNDFITAAEYNWKQISVSIVIQGIEEAKNASEQEIIDLLEARTMHAEESLGEQFDHMLIKNDNSTYTTGAFGQAVTTSKAFLGLKHLVGQNAASVGGIDPSVYTWWQSSINSTNTALTIGLMSTKYNDVSVGADQPNLVLTTQTLYEKYESLLQPQLRFTDAKTADAGFQNLLFKGAPVLYDSNVASGEMYFLNTKYLRLVGHNDVWFKATPFVRPFDKDVRYAQILSYGEFTVSNRKRQGVLTNKS